MRLSFLFFISFCFFSTVCVAQRPKDNTLADTLYGHYIPKDMEDCFRQLDGFWSDTVKQQIRQQTEQDFGASAHHGIGMWMRNNWQLGGGSRLSKYFNALGIYDPDIISGIILTSYHRWVNGNAVNLDKQVKEHLDFWTKSKLNEKERQMAEYREFKVGDTVLYDYPFGYSSAQQEKYYNDNKCIATGIVTATVDSTMAIQVLLLQGCDARGIILSDHICKGKYYKKTQEMAWTRKAKIKYMKNGQRKWFSYSFWGKPDL